MTNRALIPIVLLMAFAGALWTYFDWANACDVAANAQAKYADSAQSMNQLQQLMAKNRASISLVSESTDPAPLIVSTLRNAGFDVNPRMRISSIPLTRVEGTSIRAYRLAIPTLEGTLAEIDQLIRSIDQTDQDFQVESLALSQAKQQPNQPERWKCEFEIRYLREEMVE